MNKEGLFAHFSGATAKRYESLIEAFGTMDQAWMENKHALKRIGWKDELIHAFFLFKQSVDESKIEFDLHKKNIELIPYSSAKYPNQLKDLYDPPICLFVRGNIPDLQVSSVVVGPRRCSSYAKSILPNFIDTLAQYQIPVVSGLAYGIDALAHSRCIEQSGTTVAVLPGGVDQQSVQPKQHQRLAQSIIDSGGALVSEFPPGAEVFAHSFPKRNRIVAALSPLTLVVEAGKKSGSLITAQVAVDLHRDVAAIPQDIRSKNSAGVHRLIQQGAHLVHSPKDILNLLGVTPSKCEKSQKKLPPTDAKQHAIYELIPQHRSIHIDELRREYAGNKAEVTMLVSMLEMGGYITHQGVMCYVRKY